MRKYVFLWQLSTGFEYNSEKGCFEKAEKYPITMLGSEGCIRIDARMNIDNVRKIGMEIVNNNKLAIGFSVGVLTCNDPDNSEAQKFIKFTRIR